MIQITKYININIVMCNNVVYSLFICNILLYAVCSILLNI